MKRFIIIFFLFICFSGYSQTEYLPDITWKTIVQNVVYLGVDTFQVDVDPIDFNDPGAMDREFGNYLIDNVGHIYTIIDTSLTTVTVIDEFGVGVGPYSGAIGYVYNSVGDGSAPFIAPIVFQYLDSKAKDNADLIFKDILWREAELYGKDSVNIVWFSDLTDSLNIIRDTTDALRVDVNTNLGKDTTGIYHANRDVLDSLQYATITESQAGTNNTKIMTPVRVAEQISLNQVPYIGAEEDIYTDNNITADSIFANYFYRISVEDLIEVAASTPGDKDVISYNGTSGAWIVTSQESGGGTGSGYISEIDVVGGGLSPLYDIYQDSILRAKTIKSLTNDITVSNGGTSVEFTFNPANVLLTEFDSTGLIITENQISDLQNYLLKTNIISEQDTGVSRLATITETQAGENNEYLITPLRNAEDLELNAVPYYGVKEDIYSDYNITLDSLFANYIDALLTELDSTGFRITESQISDLTVHIDNETPAGTINGSNTIFTTANYFNTNSTDVFLNGVKQILGVNYTEGLDKIVFQSGYIPETGDYLRLNYKKYDGLFVLPTSATVDETLDYSGIELTSNEVDNLIVQLYGDGLVTNCIIDLSNTSVPTSASSAELAGLRDTEEMNNTVIVDSN